MTHQGDEDEILPGSDAHRSSRRSRVAVAIVAATAVGAVLVLVAVRDPGDRPTADASSADPTAPRDPTATFGAPTAPVPPSVSLPPGPCNQDCRVSTAVPGPVRSALDTAYPDVVVVQVVTYFDSREVLVERRVLGTVGDRVVRILLTRQTPQATLDQHSTVQGHDVQRFRVSLGANTVDVSAERTAGRKSDPAPLRRLARDPRLLVPR